MTILYLELGVFDLERISGVQRCEAGDQDLESGHESTDRYVRMTYIESGPPVPGGQTSPAESQR